MTTEKWAPIDIEQTWDANEVTIVLTTNVPCHLWMYWTTKQPWVHRVSGLHRGLTVPWDSYWCFAVWTKNEQHEEGDTYIHTFIKPDWKYCETRWFCFRGTIADLLSPSDSAIFRKHYDGKYAKVFMELWTWLGEDQPDWNLMLTEEWPWLGVAQPHWSLLFTEHWS